MRGEEKSEARTEDKFYALVLRLGAEREKPTYSFCRQASGLDLSEHFWRDDKVFFLPPFFRCSISALRCSLIKAPIFYLFSDIQFFFFSILDSSRAAFPKVVDDPIDPCSLFG